MSGPNPLDDERLFLDLAEHRERLVAWVAGLLAARVDGLGPQTARMVAAVTISIFENDLTDSRSYRWLRDEIEKTMLSPDDWDGDGDEPALLARYVQHLAGATHGECFSCGRDIAATEKFVEAGPTGGMHPRAIPICRECAG